MARLESTFTTGMQDQWQLIASLGPDWEVLHVAVKPDLPAHISLQDWEAWISQLNQLSLEEFARAPWQAHPFSTGDQAHDPWWLALWEAWLSLVRSELQVNELLVQQPLPDSSPCYCLCMGVTERQLVQVTERLKAQSYSFHETVKQTKAGSVCGQCAGHLQGMQQLLNEYGEMQLDVDSWERLVRHRNLHYEGDILCRCKKIVLKDFLCAMLRPPLTEGNVQELFNYWQQQCQVGLKCQQCTAGLNQLACSLAGVDGSCC